MLAAKAVENDDSIQWLNADNIAFPNIDVSKYMTFSLYSS